MAILACGETVAAGGEPKVGREQALAVDLDDASGGARADIEASKGTALELPEDALEVCAQPFGLGTFGCGPTLAASAQEEMRFAPPLEMNVGETDVAIVQRPRKQGLCLFELDDCLFELADGAELVAFFHQGICARFIICESRSGCCERG